jgi:hypothetical protein
VNLHNRALCLSDLGRCAEARGDHRSAVLRHAEAARTAAWMTDPIVTRTALEGLSLALAMTGDARRAGRVLGAVGALGAGDGATWSRAPEDARKAAGLVEAELGPAASDEAREEGRMLTLDELLAGL